MNDRCLTPEEQIGLDRITVELRLMNPTNHTYVFPTNSKDVAPWGIGTIIEVDGNYVRMNFEYHETLEDCTAALERRNLI